MSAAHVDWERGGEAWFLAVATDAVKLRSTVPSPPGSRIEGTLRAGGARVRFKIHGAKRQEDGTFVLDGRAIDLTRELRAALQALVSGEAPGT